MATNDQLKALVQSHGEGDDSQFYSVAMQVAAKAARGGQSKFAGRCGERSCRRFAGPWSQGHLVVV